jgi:aminocarboxymuconate-semialdehyde decarboxylase
MFYTCAANCTDPTHQHKPGYARATKKTTARLTKNVKAKKSQPLRIDVHCHYLNVAVNQKAAPHGFGQKEFGYIYATELTRQTNVKQMQDRAKPLSDISRRLKDMDKMGIDIQVVSPAPPQFYYMAEPAFGAELARETNEGIAKIVSDHPDRFVGMCTVPLQNADLAVKELDYAVNTLGLRGVEINTNVNGKNLSDPSLGLEKFFRRVQEHDITIFMHPNGFSEAARMTNHYFNNIIGNPMDTTVAVQNLIFDGVLERNPKLRIILAHSGGYISHYWARMDHGHAARPDTRTGIKKRPSSYLAKNFYFDTISFDTDMLANSIRKWGADHVVVGTDYPYDMGYYKPLEFVDKVKGLPVVDRDRIKGGNAQRLFKIKNRK